MEKFPNPYNQRKNIFIFGGCHTVGVTTAVNFFSVFSNGKSAISDVALRNAEKINKSNKFDKRKFALLIDANKIGSTISYPSFNEIIDI